MLRLSVSAIAFYQTQAFEINGAAQQFNGREGETATLYERRSLNPKLRGGGFALRHLKRSAVTLKRRRRW